MIQNGKKIFIIAGELSGDLLGAPLIRNLKKNNPGITVYGIGGNLMIQEGLVHFFHIDQLSFMGITEVFKFIPFILKVFRKIKKEIMHIKPNIIVLIDYPGFNLKLAKAVKKRGFKVFYYVSPQVWAWRKNRIKTIARYTDGIAVIFKFEEELYRGQNVAVHFVSHPILERITVKNTNKEFFNFYNIDEAAPLLGLLPGSRKQEVEKMFPIMLKAALKVRKTIQNLQIIVGNIPSLNKSVYTDIIGDTPGITLSKDSIYDIMKYSSFLIVASGTATLESAFLETPMVIVYKTSPLTYFLGKKLVKLPHIGMINILAGKEVVPELIQKDFTPEKTAETVLKFLTDPEKITAVRNELQKTKKLLGAGKASVQTAELILKKMEET